MKIKEIDKKEFVARLDDSFEQKIEAAFIGGFNARHRWPAAAAEEVYKWWKADRSGVENED